MPVRRRYNRVQSAFQGAAPFIELLLRHKGQSLLQEQGNEDIAARQEASDARQDERSAAQRKQQLQQMLAVQVASGQIDPATAQQVYAALQSEGEFDLGVVTPDPRAKIQRDAATPTAQLAQEFEHPMTKESRREFISPTITGRREPIPNAPEFERGFMTGTQDGKPRVLHTSGATPPMSAAPTGELKDRLEQDALSQIEGRSRVAGRGSALGAREVPGPPSQMTPQQALGIALETVQMPEQMSLIAQQLANQFGMSPPPGAISTAAGGDTDTIAQLNQAFSMANQILEATPNASEGRFGQIPTGAPTPQPLQAALEALDPRVRRALEALVDSPDPDLESMTLSDEEQEILRRMRAGGG